MIIMILYQFNRFWGCPYIWNDKLTSTFLQRVFTLILRTYYDSVTTFERKWRKNWNCLHEFALLFVLEFIIDNFRWVLLSFCKMVCTFFLCLRQIFWWIWQSFVFIKKCSFLGDENLLRRFRIFIMNLKWFFYSKDRFVLLNFILFFGMFF